MHLAFITPEYPTPQHPDGGLATYTKKTAAALAERGHTVTVFVLGDSADTRDDAGGGVTVWRVRRLQPPAYARWIPSLRRFSSLLEHQRSARRLAKVFWAAHDEQAFDVVQIANYFACGDALLKNGRVPVVCRICWYPPWWRTAARGPRTFVDYLWDGLDFGQVRDAEAAYAPSRFLADAYQRFEGLEVGVLPTPLSPAGAEELDDGWYREQLQGKSYLLYFGSMNGLKGVDLLAEALPGVFRDYPDLHVVLMGRDDGLPDGRSIVPLIRDAVGESAVRIISSKPLPKSQLQPVLEHAQAVLMPSRFDNLPNACMEALRAGIPVIASDQSSLEEMVRHGQNGLLFKNGDVAALEQAIRHYLDLDETARADMRAQAELSARDLEAEDRVRLLETFLQQVVDERRRAL